MSKWKPIETAPGEQVEVIVYDPDAGSCIAMKVYNDWLRSAGDDLVYDGLGSLQPYLFPTHWMPKPSPPGGSPPSDKGGEG